MNRIAIVIIGLSVVFGLAGCRDKEAQAQGKRTVALIKDPTASVTVEPAKTQTIEQTLEITGELATSADATVGAKVAGRLASVMVQDGSSVSAGQVIAQLDASTQRAQVQQALQQANAARSALDQAQTNAKIGPQKSAAAVATAQAALRSAKAQLKKAQEGARPEEISQAQSQVNSAKSAMETAKKARDRAKSLYDQGATSRQAYEQAENAYQAALSNYESALDNLRMKQSWTRPEDITAAQETVRQAEENLRTAQAQKQLDVLLTQQIDQARANLAAARAGLTLAQQNLEDATVRAPFSGKVFGKPAQPGTVLNPGAAVARVVGREGLYFDGDVPEANVTQIKQGDAVNVKLDAVGGGSMAGHIVSISPASQEVARIFRVRIALDSPPPGSIPGMFIRGQIVINRIEGATVVPTKSIVTEGEDKFVFVNENNKAKKVKVTTGAQTDGLTQVHGVTSGAQVVVDGAAGLKEGQELKIQKASPASSTDTAPAKAEAKSAMAHSGE